MIGFNIKFGYFMLFIFLIAGVILIHLLFNDLHKRWKGDLTIAVSGFLISAVLKYYTDMNSIVGNFLSFLATFLCVAITVLSIGMIYIAYLNKANKPVNEDKTDKVSKKKKGNKHKKKNQ